MQKIDAGYEVMNQHRVVGEYFQGAAWVPRVLFVLEGTLGQETYSH
jgi:hypothetical protein